MRNVTVEQLTGDAAWDAVRTSWKQGHVTVLYDDLIETFGKPTYAEVEDKIDVEWVLAFTETTMRVDGSLHSRLVTATIYNYKDGPAYLGVEGMPVELIMRWHVGGFQVAAVHMVKEMLRDRVLDR